MSDQKPATEPGRQPDLEVRAFPFEIEEVRAAENGRSSDFTIKGHASVFDTWTDLGLFRERIAKGAFDDVLTRDPHVLHLIDHDTRYVLSSTRNKTLELRVDPKGLHMWSKVAPTSYAADLRILMERGDVSQSSFAFTVADDEWNERTVDGQPVVERTIKKVAQLFDVTTTAMGAYPTTDSQVASRTLAHARSLAESLPDSPPADEDPAVTAPEGVADEGTEPPPTGVGSEESTAAQPTAAARARSELELLKQAARARTKHLQDAQYEVFKEM